MLLRVENLSTTFQTPQGALKAVDDVSFSVESGKTLGIVGESGCGKTVTALSLMRLIPEPPGRIESGKVLLDGVNILDLAKEQLRTIRGKKIAMIFQEPMTSLNPVFTVGDQIMEAILLHQNLTRQAAKKKCLEMMELVGIPDVNQRFDYYPHQMSGGLRQRVMIAMALACEPQVLIADEPTTALDVTIQAQILHLIRDLQKRLGTAVILITHDFGVIAEVCDEVAVMYAGRIIERAWVRKIFDQPAHPYTVGLQKSMPAFSRPGQPLYSIRGLVPSPLDLPDGCRFSDRCEFLQSQCQGAEPILTALDGAAHKVACYFPRNRK